MTRQYILTKLYSYKYLLFLSKFQPNFYYSNFIKKYHFLGMPFSFDLNCLKLCHF